MSENAHDQPHPFVTRPIKRVRLFRSRWGGRESAGHRILNWLLAVRGVGAYLSGARTDSDYPELYYIVLFSRFTRKKWLFFGTNLILIIKIIIILTIFGFYTQIKAETSLFRLNF